MYYTGYQVTTKYLHESDSGMTATVSGSASLPHVLRLSLQPALSGVSYGMGKKIGASCLTVPLKYKAFYLQLSEGCSCSRCLKPTVNFPKECRLLSPQIWIRGRSATAQCVTPANLLIRIIAIAMAKNRHDSIAAQAGDQ